MPLLDVTEQALRDLPGCAVVEVGSYHGRSSVLLASAMLALRPGEQIVAIDPHNGVIAGVVQLVSEVDERPEYGWRDHAGDLIVLHKHAPSAKDPARARRGPLPTPRYHPGASVHHHVSENL